MIIQNKRIITILHVFQDEKFFDSVSFFFQQLPYVKNLFCYYSKKENSFNYIKNNSIITIYTDWKEYTSLFKKTSIDIIYFHSLPIKHYKLFNYISPDKIVIWWCWGYDIYNNYGVLKPFIKVDLYKPLTKNNKTQNNIIKVIYHKIKSIGLYRLRNKVLNRIDYFSPVIPIEYELMKNNKCFRAKPFMLENGPGLSQNPLKNEIIHKKNIGNILIGNSLSLSNNHLDILNEIKNIKLENNRVYVVPINYGNDIDKNLLKHQARDIPAKFLWLETFIPISDYQKLFDSITHAIFGHMRQEAMGNITFCLRNSVKIYLYKESIIYKQLKMKGYHIFSIEEDLNKASIDKVLSEEQALHNFNLYYQTAENKIEKTCIELEQITSRMTIE